MENKNILVESRPKQDLDKPVNDRIQDIEGFDRGKRSPGVMEARPLLW